MARWWLHMAAAMVVVCLVMAEAYPSLDGEERRRVGPGSIAAGRAHTVMSMPDGRVFAWGDGDRGQIGDGALVDRAAPTEVPGLSDVVSVSAGAAHSVAVTRGGEVYAWGVNTFGRLGDGTQKTRSRPVRVTGIANIRTVAAGRAHTLAVDITGKVFAWGRNEQGQLGQGDKKPSPVPVEVRGLSNVVAIAGGGSHSIAVTGDGRVYTWGNNQSSQLGDGSTKDRLRPVQIALTDVVAVAAGNAHSLALTRTGAVYAWGQGAQGQLGLGSNRVSSTPKLIAHLHASAIAAGRNFSAAIQSDGRVAAWGANGAGQLGDGTTIRRVAPVPVAGVAHVVNLALGAAFGVAVSNGGDVSLWGDGVVSPTEVIADIPGWGPDGDAPPPPPPPPPPPDTIPPVIVASTSPALSGEWMTSPVTVSFACSDNVAVVACTAPVTVATDGYAQQVVGTAVDAAGNRTSTTVLVSVDIQPPILMVTAPQGSSTDQPVVRLTVAATDVSGVVSAQCDGHPVAVTAATFECDVALRPGRNDVALGAADLVGHTTLTGFALFRTGTATTMSLSPAERKLGVSEVAHLSLLDEYGMRVDGAFWSSSDPAIVALSNEDPPALAGLTTGEVTIRAEKAGMIAEASVVVSAGLVAGDVRWTLPTTPDYYSEPPIFAHRVHPSVPHMFAVESLDWGQSTLRAVTDDGTVLWQQQSPGVPLLGDTFGGAIAGVLDAAGDFVGFERFGGGIAPPWRFSSSGRLEPPAQANDGTLYAVESLPGAINPNGQATDKYLVVIDGETGALLSRTLLPREINNFVSEKDGVIINTSPPTLCKSARYETAPDTVGPVVGTDGRGYLVVRRYHIEKWAGCNEPFLRRADRTIDMGIDVYAFGRDGTPQLINVFSTSCAGALGTTLPCDLPVRAFQLVPDAVGGTLVTWERGTEMIGTSVFVQRSLTRIDEERTLTERPVVRHFSIEMIGQDGLALAYGENAWEAIDVVSGTTKWTSLLPGLGLIAARPDGGFAAFDFNTGNLTFTNADAEIESSQPFGGLDWRSVHESGDWIGRRNGQLTAVVGDFADATRFQPKRGNRQNQLSVRRPGVGLWLKSHNAQEPFSRWQHVSMRITPLDQDWLSRNRSKFELCDSSTKCLPIGTDPFGNKFFTIGAGPGAEDTNLQCSGILTKGFDRPNDLQTPPTEALRELPVDPRLESILIQSLLNTVDGYANNLPYHCFPEDHPGFYNSNSFTHGLLHASSLSHDEAPPTRRQAPGWLTPVPLGAWGR